MKIDFKQLRKENKYSQKDINKITGIGLVSLGKLESSNTIEDQMNHISFKNLLQLCELYNLDIYNIIENISPGGIKNE